jgi:hypothetical protein
VTATTPPPPPAPPPAWNPATPGPYYASAPQTSGMSVASLVLGIVSIFCFGLLLVPPILAVVFGNLALDRIAGSGGTVKGRGMAIAGIVLGWIAIAAGAAIAIAWLVYGLTNL